MLCSVNGRLNCLKIEACECLKFSAQTCRLNSQAVHLSLEVQVCLGVPVVLVGPVVQAPLLVPLLRLVLEGPELPGDQLGLAPLSALDKPGGTKELGFFLLFYVDCSHTNSKK